MAESKYLTLSDDSSKNGQISLAPEVIEIIAGITAEQVQGVHLVNSSFSKGVSALLGLESGASGIKLTEDDRGLVIEVNVVLDFGISVPQTAAKLQEKIKQQILFMTEIVINEVNIEVDGMLPEETNSSIDPDDIFAEKDGEEK
ncbi:Asp23/Gls24 family envelope stress response protein [Pediococcus argentinicus]|uniref:Alkaline shock protein n=1 Tax=Pediococcus argentinicus TaxID=480391 RepID=A0A0R2NMV8_9LACO|nr:Asp23/Gls24 family envelope stress response protein [Pediococcus argentinicus]KRO25187.1 hypothetical protein IV88_GL000414 [Pediococcus argentinicus]NKZ22445.1 Asp23/Gls24 family envelope stress response protein [Pediococcus argentinicus]GEP19545.1 alkaline-shock protein [Pediococcus argentinicus]